MNGKTKVQEMYNEFNKDEIVGDKINDLLTDVVTEILQVPGVSEAVLLHIFNKRIDLEERVDIHDVPFQYLWELLFSVPLQEENKGEQS